MILGALLRNANYIPAEHKHDHIGDALLERVEMGAETWKINTNQSLVLRHRSMTKRAVTITRRWLIDIYSNCVLRKFITQANLTYTRDSIPEIMQPPQSPLFRVVRCLVRK